MKRIDYKDTMFSNGVFSEKRKRMITMLTHFWENRTLKVGSNLQSNIAFMFEGKSYEVLECQFILFRYFVSNEKFA